MDCKVIISQVCHKYSGSLIFFNLEIVMFIAKHVLIVIILIIVRYDSADKSLFSGKRSLFC